MTQDMQPDILDSVRGELLASSNACFPRLSLTLNDIVLERSRRNDSHLTTPLPRRIASAVALSAPQTAQLLLNHFRHDSRFVNAPFIDPNDASGCIHFTLSTHFISDTILTLCQRTPSPFGTTLTPPTVVTTVSAEHVSAPGTLRAAFAADSIAHMLSAAPHQRGHHHLIVLNTTTALPLLKSLEQLGIQFDTHQALAAPQNSQMQPHQQLCTHYLDQLRLLGTHTPLIVYHGSSLSGLYPLIKAGAEALGLSPPHITLRAPVQSGSWNLSTHTNSTPSLINQLDVRTIRFCCIDTADAMRISLDLIDPKSSASAKAFHYVLSQQHNAHALLEAAAARGRAPDERLTDTALSGLCPEERALVTQLCMVYEACSQARRNLSARALSRYLVQLSTAFETMYMKCPVFGDNLAQSAVRIVLCKAFAETVSALLHCTGL